ncbi:MAG: AMP-binding protein, partial [Myxococcales bacterium]|nr:AMP-binding protein [Myxococcales bacterium]
MSARRVTVADGLGSLAAELRRRADTDGADEIALRFSDGGGAGATSAWSWADAWEQARRVAAALREDGIRAGDRLLVVAPDVRAAVAAHFGAWALGAVPIHLGLP